MRLDAREDTITCSGRQRRNRFDVGRQRAFDGVVTDVAHLGSRRWCGEHQGRGRRLPGTDLVLARVARSDVHAQLGVARGIAHETLDPMALGGRIADPIDRLSVADH
jgi:hypothetical protein